MSKEINPNGKGTEHAPRALLDTLGPDQSARVSYPLDLQSFINEIVSRTSEESF